MKRWMILNGKRILPAAFCAAAVCAAAVLSLGRAAFLSASAEPHHYPIRRVQTAEQKVALSFDSDSDDQETQRLLAVLRRYHVQSTFFVTGAWVDKYPASAKAIADAGHELGNHSDTHPRLTRLNRAQLSEQISACSRKVQAAAGVRPALFRPPYGGGDARVVAAAESLGLLCVEWDVDSLDWRNLTPRQIAERVTEQVRPGSIVLFQNGAKNTAAALPKILDTLLSEGYSVVPVSRLVYSSGFVVDETGLQRKADSEN